MQDFSAHIERMEDCEAILEYVYAQLTELGASWMTYHFKPVFDPHTSRRTVIWVRGLSVEEQKLYVQVLRNDDPVPALTFAHGPILCWRDAEKITSLDDHVTAHLAKLRELKIDNWAGFALYGPRNRDAFGSAGFPTDPGELDDGILTAAHSLLMSAHLQVCRIMDGANPNITLSQREKQVLELMGNGKTGGEIGTILKISPETVKTYTKRIYEKLETNDRVTATVRALKLGLIEI